MYVCLSGVPSHACDAGCNICLAPARCQKLKCAENVRIVVALQKEVDLLKRQFDGMRLSSDRRASLEWESAVCELRRERDEAVSRQRACEKRARDADIAAASAQVDAKHARAEAKEAREAVRVHAVEMLVALDACTARMAEDTARAAQDADDLLLKERAAWCRVVSKQKDKLAAVSEMHDTAQQLLEEREAAHSVTAERTQEIMDEVRKNANNARRRASNWEKRIADLTARMPPMPAKPDSDAVPVEQQSTTTKATTRCRFIAYLMQLFAAFEWSDFNLRCLATALFKSGLLDQLWDTREMNIIYFAEVNTLHARMEHEIFGERFGLFCHLELGLTLPQIVLLAQATCKQFMKVKSRYETVVVDYSSYSTQLTINAIRITPPRSFLEPIIRGLKADTGLTMSANGRVSLRPMLPVVAEIIDRDGGRCGTPTRAELRDGAVLDICVSLDATGFGALQVTTLVIMNPRLPQTSANCDILGMGNVSDGGAGAIKLLGPNREVINKMISSAGLTPTSVLMPDNTTLPVRIKIWNVADLSCVRHCEHLLCSGMCCCDRTALRRVPPKPTDIDEMKALCGECVGPALPMRQALGHRKHDDRVLPCPCCDFGHSDNPEAEYNAFRVVELRLQQDTSKGHAERLNKWSLDHAHKHLNVKPLDSGEPTFDCNMMDQLPDVLHMLDLNMPSRPHSHGLIRNCSDIACDKVALRPLPPPTLIQPSHLLTHLLPHRR